MPRERAGEFNAAKADRSSERSLGLQPARERGVEEQSEDFPGQRNEGRGSFATAIGGHQNRLSAGEKERGRE